MTRFHLLVLAIAVLAVAGIAATFLGSRPVACRDFNQARVSTPTTTLSVALARTAVERGQGLAGCTNLPNDAGMYFVYDTPAQVTYWMKGMLIPIDIVWIADGKVVDVEANVPPLKDAIGDAEIPRYRSPQAVTGVLEVEAGKAAEYGLTTGVPVTLIR